MNRSERIEKGLIWQVYEDATPEVIVFEGTKTACQNFIKLHGLQRQYKRGVIRLAKLILELPEKN